MGHRGLPKSVCKTGATVICEQQACSWRKPEWIVLRDRSPADWKQSPYINADWNLGIASYTLGSALFVVLQSRHVYLLSISVLCRTDPPDLDTSLNDSHRSQLRWYPNQGALPRRSLKSNPLMTRSARNKIKTVKATRLPYVHLKNPGTSVSDRDWITHQSPSASWLVIQSSNVSVSGLS